MVEYYELVPYGTMLAVGIHENPSLLTAQINLKLKGINIEAPHEGAVATTYERFHVDKKTKHQKQYIFVIFKESAGVPNVMAHEAVHVVNFVFDHVGVHLDANNDEAQAYLTGHVVELMNQTIEKYYKKNGIVLKKIRKNGKKD